MKIRDYASQQVIKQLARILPDCSDKTLLRGTYLLEKIARKKHKGYVRYVRNAIEKRHPAKDFIKRILKEMNPNCREKVAVNLVANGLLINSHKRMECFQKGGCSPTNILISPTMRCNLKCKGCYAANYSKKDDLDFKVIDRIIQEAKDNGAAFFTILGGEPFLRKDVLNIFKKNNDSYFQIYTNGTLINENMAKKLAELGNVMPELSIEGFEERTDDRRGKGTFKRLMKSMNILKRYRVPFGYSVCVTRENVKEVFSDKFVDLMISKGAYIGWYFLYMPVCRDPDFSLMPTPEQRAYMLEKGRYIRSNKPIFIVDFWNDAPAVGGCIAGKDYVHITSKGDVEPCIFTHFAADNIKNKSLKEVMNSAFFKELRRRQPYNENLLLPCMWIDNPEVSREMHKKFNLRPTHPGADDILKKKKHREFIDQYSERVKKVYTGLWKDIEFLYKEK